MIKRGRSLTALFSLIFFLGFVSSVYVQENWNGDFADGCKEFDRLTKDRKYEAASSLVEKMLSTARGQENAIELPRCLKIMHGKSEMERLHYFLNNQKLSIIIERLCYILKDNIIIPPIIRTNLDACPV